ncbi:MAG: D-alanyl-D-alanine carboxypeptidase/D-alanyl-D-alanine-endopeptidase [Planctomycetes bacterium]|nr:D-alanyl-D-alanine carboxypeptidase/D-alanyl-D-alanine-endopeptidase [Planctomycetota bacterium]
MAAVAVAAVDAGVVVAAVVAPVAVLAADRSKVAGRFRALLLAALGTTAPFATAQERTASAPEGDSAARALAAILADPLYRNSRWGVLAVDVTDGRRLLAHREREVFLTASSLKLVATACALAELRAEHRFRTELWAHGELRSGTLHGDLFLRGSGDPSFGGALEAPGGAAFDAFGAAVLDAGIARIRGRVLGDDSAQEERGFGHGWAWDDQHAWYAAPLSGLCYRENVFTAVVEWPLDERHPRLRAEPPCSLLELLPPVQVRAVAPAEAPAIEFWRSPGTHRYRARGALEPGGKAWRYDLCVEDPALYAAASFADLLSARGCRFELPRPFQARCGVGELPQASRLLAVWHSPALGELVRRTNTASQNLYAEQLLRAAAKRFGGRADIETARRLVAAYLRAWGGDPADGFLADGSGLSRENLMAPEAFVALLRAQLEAPHATVFFDSLPIGGRTGTLRERLGDLPVGIELRAKTGSLTRVKALCGYLTRRGEVRRVFSILVNDTTRADGEEVKRDIDRLVLALAEDLARES